MRGPCGPPRYSGAVPSQQVTSEVSIDSSDENAKGIFRAVYPGLGELPERTVPPELWALVHIFTSFFWVGQHPTVVNRLETNLTMRVGLCCTDHTPSGG